MTVHAWHAARVSRAPAPNSLLRCPRAARRPLVARAGAEGGWERPADLPDPVDTRFDQHTKPWHFGFQLNERYLEWDASAGRQLLRMVVSQRLERDLATVDAQLRTLAALLPSLASRLENMKADLVCDLLRDPDATADALLAIKQELPGCDVDSLVARLPAAATRLGADGVRDRVQAWRDALPDTDIPALVAKEPRLLNVTDIPALFEEIARLMPGSEPAEVLVTSPGLVLPMEVSGLESSAERGEDHLKS
ncbi:unnamed protein product [Pedinophyceae sp. YPF-701]|nr:unnamed protein product [Pedinophyceae sp. YPF-701]